MQSWAGRSHAVGEARQPAPVAGELSSIRQRDDKRKRRRRNRLKGAGHAARIDSQSPRPIGRACCRAFCTTCNRWEQRRALAALAPVQDAIAFWTTRRKSGSASDYLRGNPRVGRAIGPWLKCGFGLYMSEVFLRRPRRRYLRIAPMLPPDLRAWFRFLKKEAWFWRIAEARRSIRSYGMNLTLSAAPAWERLAPTLAPTHQRRSSWSHRGGTFSGRNHSRWLTLKQTGIMRFLRTGRAA